MWLSVRFSRTEPSAMYGTRLLLMKQGKIVCMGTPEDVLTFSTLEQAYGCVVLVDKNPLGGVPRIIPVPGRFVHMKILNTG